MASFWLGVIFVSSLCLLINGQSFDTSYPGLVQNTRGPVYVRPRSGDDVASQSNLWNSLLRFTLALDQAIFQQYAATSSDGQVNHAFSPISIATALSVIMRGAHGLTFEELWRALQYGDPVSFPPYDRHVHEQFQRAVAALSPDASSGEEMKIANALFMQSGYKLYTDFREDVKKYYDADVTGADFRNNPDGAKHQINKWVADNTQQKIKELLKSPPLPSTNLVIGNAVYFNGAWENPFPKSLTRFGTFHVSDSDKLTLPMMVNSFDTGYYNDKELNAQIVELPYLGGRFSMFILQSNSPGFESLNSLEESLNRNHISRLVNSMVKQTVMMTLPRFKIEHQMSLVPSLANLGINTLFGPYANLTRLTPDRAAVNEIIHQVIVEVTENGTTAAAATAAFLDRSGGVKVFRCNRPFIFFIGNNEAKLMLFWGKVVRPIALPGYEGAEESAYRPAAAGTRPPQSAGGGKPTEYPSIIPSPDRPATDSPYRPPIIPNPNWQSTQSPHPQNTNRPSIIPQNPNAQGGNRPIIPQNPNASGSNRPTIPENPNAPGSYRPIIPQNPNASSGTSRPIIPENPNAAGSYRPIIPQNPNGGSNRPIIPPLQGESEQNRPAINTFFPTETTSVEQQSPNSKPESIIPPPSMSSRPIYHPYTTSHRPIIPPEDSNSNYKPPTEQSQTIVFPSSEDTSYGPPPSPVKDQSSSRQGRRYYSNGSKIVFQ